MNEQTLLATSPALSRKDFVTSQEVRWCPGCGDYAILAAVQKALPELGIPREKFVFISGIGCSSRFPYYMNTYGIHSIHGRAPTLATGLNVVDPELQIWLVTGDGDGLSIGGNHMIHCIRRNVNLRILLFNNRIYGLTKGQYSPTSLPGHTTKSSPMGSIEQSLNPIGVALAAEGTFIARTVDVYAKHMGEVLKAAAFHQGTAFTEIYQNCIIFNKSAWDHVTDQEVREDNVLFLKHGEPMIFGKNLDKGIRLNGLKPEVVQLGDGITEADLLVHDAHAEDPTLAWMLSRMEPPYFPVPLGVFRSVRKPTYAELALKQNEEALRRRGPGDLRKLYMDSDTWEVTGEPALAAAQNGSNGHA
jgi:2-oxoglutarate ferredoxin oxidoreductase subunit beta